MFLVLDMPEQFSKLDDIVTPLTLLELFFDDILVDMTVGLTKLYSYRKKTGVSSEITNKQIRLFLSMLLLSRCLKLPDRKMYQKTSLVIFIRALSNSIPCNTFERTGNTPEHILWNLHLCDYKQLDK